MCVNHSPVYSMRMVAYVDPIKANSFQTSRLTTRAISPRTFRTEQSININKYPRVT